MKTILKRVRRTRQAPTGKEGQTSEVRSQRSSPVSCSYTATEAKSEFGRVLEEAVRGATVVITKHDSPKAVLISVDQFNALRQAPELSLDALRGEFDALIAQMQGAKARSAMEAAFHASPRRLGRAAVLALRKRG